MTQMDVFEHPLNCTSCTNYNNNFIMLKVELCKFVGQHHCVTLLRLLKKQLSYHSGTYEVELISDFTH